MIGKPNCSVRGGYSLIAMVTFAVASSSAVFAEGRTWTTSDSANVTYFTANGVVPSPDGRRFFFKTFHGDLSCDCNVYDLTVFDTEDVRRALQSADFAKTLKPAAVLTRRPVTHGGPDMYNAQWDPDGESITFLGVDGKGFRQIDRFNVVSGTVTALTAWEQGVGIPLRVGDTVIADVTQPGHHSEPNYPMYVITRSYIRSALSPHAADPTVTLVAYRFGPPWQLKGRRLVGPLPAVSSDGRLAVAVCAAVDAPQAWADYDAVSSGGSETPSSVQLGHFVLVDAEHGSEKAMLDAPTGRATRVGAAPSAPFPQALWAKDERHVILVNAALPLERGRDSKRTGMAYVVGYDTKTSAWTVLEPLESQGKDRSGPQVVSRVGWLERGTKLLVQHRAAGKAAPSTVYSLRGNRWIASSADATLGESKPAPLPALGAGLRVAVKQSDNDPPVVMASDGEHELALTSPDPALAGVQRAREVAFEWQEPNGRRLTGGLLLPPETETHPVPLAIQGYYYQPKVFAPDGPERNPFAAQQLVARGIAVLNVNIPGTDPAVEGTPRELTDYAMEVDSAADALAARGLVDRSRVGLIGFSRSAYEAYYVVTHPGKHPLTAAVVEDGFPGTYGDYLISDASDGANNNGWERMYGGSFWKSKGAWLSDEGTFNADRVQTPVLFSIHGQEKLTYTLDTFGAFSLNRRPFEYLMFPQGEHGLDTPRERAASQEASVDWMSFWLQGYEDPSPEKAEQYKRWRKIRADWAVTQKHAAAAHHDGEAHLSGEGS